MDLSQRGTAPDIGESFFNPIESVNSINEVGGSDSAKVCDFVENIAPHFGERLDIGHNAAVDTVADTIYDELRAGFEIHFMTNSRDEAVTKRALQDVKNRFMLEDRLTARETENLMSKVIVETFQSSAAA